MILDSMSVTQGCDAVFLTLLKLQEYSLMPLWFLSLPAPNLSTLTSCPHSNSLGAKCLNWAGKFWWTNKIFISRSHCSNRKQIKREAKPSSFARKRSREMVQWRRKHAYHFAFSSYVFYLALLRKCRVLVVVDRKWDSSFQCVVFVWHIKIETATNPTFFMDMRIKLSIFLHIDNPPVEASWLRPVSYKIWIRGKFFSILVNIREDDWMELLD